jgi:hypothetical protein
MAQTFVSHSVSPEDQTCSKCGDGVPGHPNVSPPGPGHNHPSSHIVVYDHDTKVYTPYCKKCGVEPYREKYGKNPY